MPHFFKRAPITIKPFSDKAWDDFFYQCELESPHDEIFNFSPQCSDTDSYYSPTIFSQESRLSNPQEENCKAIMKIIARANELFRKEPYCDEHERKLREELLDDANRLLNINKRLKI